MLEISCCGSGVGISRGFVTPKPIFQWPNESNRNRESLVKSPGQVKSTLEDPKVDVSVAVESIKIHREIQNSSTLEPADNNTSLLPHTVSDRQVGVFR